MMKDTKKVFEEPNIEIEKFHIEDIITTSYEEGDPEDWGGGRV